MRRQWTKPKVYCNNEAIRKSAMNFQASLEYLYNLGYELSVKKFGLENTFKLLAALDNPEKDFLKVQVAGTNGKGSTCAFLEAICLAAKIKVGLYTSPHLVSVTERIRVNGREISERDFARHAAKVKSVSESLVENGEVAALPTFFEQLTAIALNAFREAEIEIAILETGIGGRFDSTTATKAEIVALTPIDYDHQNILGNSLAEIASEKAAVIRADTRVVLSAQQPEAEKVIYGACERFGVKPKRTDFIAELVGADESGKYIVNFRTREADYEQARLNLAGKHQIENAKVAVLLAEILRESGFEITPQKTIEGLRTAKHKGRLEFKDNFLFDGAHNVSGARALREFLDEFIEQPVTMIFGAMKDKDLSEISEILFPKAAVLIFTEPDNPRAMNSEELTKFLPADFEREKAFVTNTVAEALKIARNKSGENDLICVTGSLYLIGEMQKILRDESCL